MASLQLLESCALQVQASGDGAMFLLMVCGVGGNLLRPPLPLRHLLCPSPAATAFQWLAFSDWLARCLSLLVCFFFCAFRSPVTFSSAKRSEPRVMHQHAWGLVCFDAQELGPCPFGCSGLFHLPFPSQDRRLDWTRQKTDGDSHRTRR